MCKLFFPGFQGGGFFPLFCFSRCEQLLFSDQLFQAGLSFFQKAGVFLRFLQLSGEPGNLLFCLLRGKGQGGAKALLLLKALKGPFPLGFQGALQGNSLQCFLPCFPFSGPKGLQLFLPKKGPAALGRGGVLPAAADRTGLSLPKALGQAQRGVAAGQHFLVLQLPGQRFTENSLLFGLLLLRRQLCFRFLQGLFAPQKLPVGFLCFFQSASPLQQLGKKPRSGLALLYKQLSRFQACGKLFLLSAAPLQITLQLSQGLLGSRPLPLQVFGTAQLFPAFGEAGGFPGLKHRFFPKLFGLLTLLLCDILFLF